MIGFKKSLRQAVVVMLSAGAWLACVGDEPSTSPAASGDSGTTDAGAADTAADDGGSLDGSDACRDLPAGSTSGKLVRLLYLVPSDRLENPRVKTNLAHALRNVQLWLRQKMPQKVSFQVHDPVVEVVTTDHEASWYSTNDPSMDGGEAKAKEHWPQWNAAADATPMHSDSNSTWLLALDADVASDQHAVVGTKGRVVLTANTLRLLVGQAEVPPRADANRCWAVGSLAWGTATALGMTTPPECTGDAGTTSPECPKDNVRVAGVRVFPNLTLTGAQVDWFTSSGFATASALPDCTLDCSTAIP